MMNGNWSKKIYNKTNLNIEELAKLSKTNSTADISPIILSNSMDFKTP